MLTSKTTVRNRITNEVESVTYRVIEADDAKNGRITLPGGLMPDNEKNKWVFDVAIVHIEETRTSPLMSLSHPEPGMMKVRMGHKVKE